MNADLKAIATRAECVFTPPDALAVDVRTLLAEVDRLTTERSALANKVAALTVAVSRYRQDAAMDAADLLEARATIAAERGLAEGASSEGWKPRGDWWDGPANCCVVRTVHGWTCTNGWGGRDDWMPTGEFPTARAAMQAADAALRAVDE